MFYTDLQEFVTVVKTNNCKIVTVYPYLRIKGFWSNLLALIMECINPVTAHYVDHPYEYVVEATSVTSAGKKLYYEGVCFERRDHFAGFLPPKERGLAALKHYLTADMIVKEIKRGFPGVTVDLISPDGKMMGENMYKKLYDDARKHGMAVA